MLVQAARSELHLFASLNKCQSEMDNITLPITLPISILRLNVDAPIENSVVCVGPSSYFLSFRTTPQEPQSQARKMLI